MADFYLAKPICHIFNASIDKGIFPTSWKIAKVIPIRKNAKENLCAQNSRPISLLSVLSKILEKLITEQVKQFFRVNNLFTKFQHAYREGHSTATALTQMVDDCYNHIDNKKLVGAVLLDFSSAFDLLDHEILLEKLKSYGFSLLAVNWFESYLSGRKQSVFYNGSFSSLKELKCGVPQGSCLGPLLFSIFTNDLPLVLDHAKAVMYADDTTIYFPAASADALTETLNAELNSVVSWTNANRLVLNVLKTKTILFGSNIKLKENPKLKIVINSTTVSQVEDTKLLGVILDSTLKWSKHIEGMAAIMGRQLALIRSCSKYFPKDLFPLVIKTMVLSHLHYCSVVWSCASEKDMEKLQLVQNKAARIALNCSRYTSIQRMHRTLGWPLVKNKFNFALICFLRNIVVSKYPTVLYEKLFFSCVMHSVNTRHAAHGHFTLPVCNTTTGQKSVTFRGMKVWNSLPAHITDIANRNLFKKCLMKHCCF